MRAKDRNQSGYSGQGHWKILVLGQKPKMSVVLPWPKARNTKRGGLTSHYHSSSKWTHLPKGYMRGCDQNFNPFWSTTLEQDVWIVMVEMDYIYSSISVHLLNDIRGKCQKARQGPSGLEAIENGLALDPTYCFPGNTRKVNINFAPD